MKYMMLIKHAENFEMKDVPPALFEAMGQFVEANMKSGVIVDTAGLKKTRDGSRVRLERGTLTVTDGPFVETKEVVGGYAIVEAASREQALQVARDFMEIHRIHFPAFDGECEMRPFEDM
jgi:hypothetical protein